MSDPIVTLLETITQSALILDYKKRVWLANAAFYDAFALQAAQTLQQPLFDLEGGAWNLPDLHTLLDTLESGEKCQAETDLEAEFPAAGYKALHIRARRIATDNPAIWAVLAIEDLTERQQAAAMQVLEQQFRALTDDLPIALWVLDTEGRVILLTGRGNTGFIFPPEAIIGRSIFELYADYPNVLKTARRMLSGEAFSQIEETNGRFWQAYYRPLYDAEGVITGAMSTGIDITESRRAEAALQRQTELHQTIIDNIPVMLAYFDANNKWLFANRYFEQRLGWNFAAWKSQEMELFRVLYPDPVLRQHVIDFIGTAEGAWADFPVHTRDGTVIETSWANIRLSDGSNIGIGIDITERKRAEREHLEHLERAGALANLAQMMAETGLHLVRVLEIVTESITEHIGDGCVISLIDDTLPLLNTAVAHHHNSAARTALQKLALSHHNATPFLRHLIQFGLPLVMNNITPTQIEKLLDEYHEYYAYVRQFGLHSLILIPLHARERVFGILAAFRDVTTHPFSASDQAFLQAVADQAGLAVQNARLFEEVRTGHERMRQLAQEVITAQEAERQRVSRELHDEAGQALTALKISLQMIAHDLPADQATARERVQEMVQLTERTMEQVRLLARALRPPALDTVGLASTIEGYCREFERRTKLAVAYSGALRHSLSDTASIALYRCLQEALTNVAKHAHATVVKVSLEDTGDSVVLTVEDNGQGIALSDDSETGIGLDGLRERLELLNGSLEIVAPAARGTRLVARVPVETLA